MSSAAFIFELLKIVPEITKFFTTVIVPVASKLLKFSLPRVVRLPVYLNLLWLIYSDLEADSEARKLLTSVLLILGSILAFMAYSYVPLTGLPIIGALTTPVAAMIAIFVSLVSLELIFRLQINKYSQNFPEEVRRDITELEEMFGKSWEDVISRTQDLLNAVKEKIDPDHIESNTLLSLINALMIYLWEPKNNQSLSANEINRRIVTEGLPRVVKFSGSGAEGLAAALLAGTAAKAVASNIFVQAGFWTSVKAFFGASGIIVKPALYSLLTGSVPVFLALGTGSFTAHGAMVLRDEGEKEKLSKFLAEILIATLPMCWADGEFSVPERDQIIKLLGCHAINKQDANRVYDSMEKYKTFDRVLEAGILKEKNPEKARMKSRLLLSVTYEIAQADGVVSSEELTLHKRMAQVMDIPEVEAREIRKLTLLKYGIDLSSRVQIVEGDLLEQLVDAIVNSANSKLIPDKKLFKLFPKNEETIDSTIFRNASSSLENECKNLKGCGVGEAKITQIELKNNLEVQWAIHTVCPTWDGSNETKELLAKCYQHSLILGHRNSIRSLAFPALATGTGGFPLNDAATIAMNEIQQFLSTHFSIEQVVLVCKGRETYEAYLNAYEKIVCGTPVNLSTKTQKTALLAKPLQAFC